MTKPSFNFDQPVARYDDELAHNGSPVPVYDENDNYRGTWFMTLRDERDQTYRAKEIRYYKTNSHRIREIKDDAMRQMDKLVELSVVGWKDIKAGGKEVPYSKEAAKAYLSQAWAYFDLDYLWRASAMVAFFQSEEDTKEDEAGK